MNDIILLKLGEIVLKGLNRKSFEQKLVSNVRRRLAHIGKFRVYCLQSTVYVEAAEDGADMDAAFEALQKVFGIVKLSRAAACEKDKDAIAKLAIDYLRDDMLRAKSFKVESKRSDKSFPMTSVELSQYVGGELNEAYPNVEVDVHDPDLVVNIEVRDLAAYVHAAPVSGAGGMPRRRRDAAFRRYRQSGLVVYDRKARRAPYSAALFLLPVYLRAGQGKSHRAWQHADRVLRPHDA